MGAENPSSQPRPRRNVANYLARGLAILGLATLETLHPRPADAKTVSRPTAPLIEPPATNPVLINGKPLDMAVRADEDQPGASSSVEPNAEILPIPSSYNWTNLRLLRIGPETKNARPGDPDRDKAQAFFATVADAMEKTGHPTLLAHLDKLKDAAVDHTYLEAAGKPARIMLGFMDEAERDRRNIKSTLPFSTAIGRTFENPDGVSHTLEIINPAIDTTSTTTGMAELTFHMEFILEQIKLADALRTSGQFNRDSFIATTKDAAVMRPFKEAAAARTLKIFRDDLGLLGPETSFYDDMTAKNF